jgi:hypothetical protein
MDAIPAGFFHDAVNPTDEEVIRWANIKGANYPPEMSQDWDICITEPRRADLFLRLASDEKCPNRKFFLACLYLLIGDAVRTNGHTWSLEEASQWLMRQSTNYPKDVVTFFQKAGTLLMKPETFDYNKWCWHGHAYEIDDELSS